MENAKHKDGVLSYSDATNFRAMAARANYLALDRPDIAYPTKELCKCFAHPNLDALKALTRIVRYLCGCHRLVWVFKFQRPTDNVILL